MIKVTFTSEIIETLKQQRYHHPHAKVQRRMQALYLKSQAFSHEHIMIVCDISSRSTLCQWFHLYEEGGVKALAQLKYHKPVSELEEYKESIQAHLEKHPPRSINEAVRTIEELTGIKRSPTQVRQFLKKLGFKRLKVGCCPGKALDEEKLKEQQSFYDEELEPRLAEAQQAKRELFFVDAAHFVHGHFLTVLWCLQRLFIPSASGRKRFNVLGALHAVSKDLISVCNVTTINTESVCELLDKIKAAYPANIPITLVLDNARYQRNKIVIAHAETLDIELLFLPSYSPNLNLIERLWKFVKKECLYGKYYHSFDDFKLAIQSCITLSSTTHKKELSSLLSLSFQFFKNVHFLPV